MPLGGPFLDQPAIDQVRAWISAGAQNNWARCKRGGACATMSRMGDSKKESLLSRLTARWCRKSAAPAAHVPARPFQAISIFRGVQACEMARKFSDHRFLARDAPQLPMIGCTMPQACECRYIRHKDRRSEPRRLMDFGASSRLYIGKERRRLKGRRATDV